MQKSFLIAHSNMRKAVGQTVTVTVLVLIAALLLNLWLMITTDYKQNFYRYHDKLNAEHVTLAVDDISLDFTDFIKDVLEKDDRTTEYSVEKAMHMVGAFNYNSGDVSSEIIFMEKEAALSRPIGRVEIVEDSEYSSGVYMPILYKSEEIRIGNEMELKIGSNVMTYTVLGFFNSAMAGSHNCAMCLIVLTEDKYTELEEFGYAPKSTLCSVRINDKSESQEYEAALKSAVTANYPDIRNVSNSYVLVSQSRYISQMICSGVMGAMTLLVLMITLVVIISNIADYIRENMSKLGALKAIGYTNFQLVCALLTQFLSVTVIASLVGAGLSYCIFPAINTMMIAQTGMPYAMSFLPLPLIISLLILGGAVAFTVWLSSRKMKKIEPITALRSGVNTHNFKRNHVPLEKTKAPLGLALALKTTLSGIKQNITVFVTILVLSLVIAFSGLVTENIVSDITPFLNMIVGETADGCINVQAEIEEEFLKVMSNDERVEKYYLFTSEKVRHADGVELQADVSDDFNKTNNHDVVYEGRAPKYFNEIAVAGKYAKDTGLKIGEEIEITAGGNTGKYLITGFTQVTNNLGKDCRLTRSGYEQLKSLQNTSYYYNLIEGSDIDEFNSEMKNLFGQNVNTTINIATLIEGTGSVYVSLMTIIVIAILILSALIIALVLYMLVKTLLGNKKRDYGIQKALGFTTRQLVLQTAMSFMPAIIISAAIGLVISGFAVKPLMSLFLRSIGIIKCTFTVPIDFIVIAGFGLITVAFGITCLLSLRVKKIAPCSLLNN